jgi:hypothetical protein
VRCLSALLALLMVVPVLPAAPAREPIVQVEDENHKRVAGAVVLFTLPTQGAGGAFANGVHTLTTATNGQGQAIARGFQANGAKGSYQMRVNAPAGGGAGAASGISGKLIAVNNTGGSIATTITPGAGAVGPPR